MPRSSPTRTRASASRSRTRPERRACLAAGAAWIVLCSAGGAQADDAGLAALQKDLLATPSATATLEHWCADHHLADPPVLVAVPLDATAEEQQVPAEAELRALLGASPDEPIRHRRVALDCGAHRLSVADNWYLPARLTPAMNEALEHSQTPFGRVVAPLSPTRRTLAASQPWHGVGAPPPQLFVHRALVVGGDGRPLALVIERYQSHLLD